MKKILLVMVMGIICLLSPQKGNAQQFGLYQNCYATSPMGQALAGVQVYFLTQPANTTTLTPLATVYSNTSGVGGPVTQPLTTNGFGTCSAYLANALYTVCFVSSVTGQQCFADQLVTTPSAILTGVTSDGSSGLNIVGGVTQGGPLSFSSNPAANTSLSNLIGANFLSLFSQTGSTPQAQFTNLISGATQQSLVFVSPQVTGGTSTSYPSASNPLNSLVRVFDTRGTNCMDWYGTFNNNSNNIGGPCIYAVENRQDSTNSYSADFSFGYDSSAGGLYNFNGSSGTKSNRFTLMVNGVHYTVAQKWGIMTNITSYVGGETIPIGIQNTEYGGYVSSGQEPSEGVRIEQDQGTASDSLGGVWKATVVSKSGSTVTFSATVNQTTLAESRFIRDLTKEITGSYSAVSCSGLSPTTCTITGSGFSALSGYATNPHTTWNSLSTGGNILTNNAVFCLPLQNGSTMDICVPITNIASDTSLTVNMATAGPQQNSAWEWATSGSYAIYPSAYPTAINQAAGTFTASDNSGIAVGDTIDQVIAYNTEFEGIRVLQGQEVGVIGPTGIVVANYAPTGSIPGVAGVDVFGNYACGFCLDPENGVVSNYGLYANSGGLPMTGLVGWAGSLPSTGTFDLLGNMITYEGATPQLNLGGSQHISINTSTGEIGFGLAPQSGTEGYFYYNNAAEHGFHIGPAVAPNSGIFPFQVDMGGGVPAFYVKGTGSSQVEVAVNNGQILNGYSGNQSGNTWNINSSSGLATFAGIKTTTYVTSSIGGSALTAGTCATGTVSVSGSTTGMVVDATPVSYPGAAFFWNAYVSSSGTVTVSVCTNLAAGGTPTASTYNVRVIQ